MTAINPAPVGSLLKGPKPQKPKRADLGRKPRERDEKHLAALRKCPCILCGSEHAVEASHIRMNNGPKTPNPGMGQKPNDRFALPLCHQEHMEQHAHPRGERGFWEDHKINPFEPAAELYALRGDVLKMRGYIHRFRGGL